MIERPTPEDMANKYQRDAEFWKESYLTLVNSMGRIVLASHKETTNARSCSARTVPA